VIWRHWRQITDCQIGVVILDIIHRAVGNAVDRTNAIAARAKVTPESLLQEAEEARQGAMENRQFSAAVTAVKEKSILSGHRIERCEVGPPGAFDTMTDDELERALIERLSALGLTPDAGSDTRY
jgi:hypothetical protein